MTSESSNFVEKFRAEVAEQPVLSQEEIGAEGFYVFFSFDLVESTRYKTLNRRRWPLVTKKFYEFVEDGIRKRIPHMHLWKYVGDELLLYKRIRHISDLRPLLSAVYEVMIQTTDRLHEQFRDTRTVLSVKSTVWSAWVEDIKPQDMRTAKKEAEERDYENIVVSHQSVGTGRERLDFLGPDVDAGFRISKFAIRKRLVVSAELAYLMYKDRANNEAIENQLKIVSYESLKGVWEGRRYPIIWYEPKWEIVPSSFLYDEHHQHEIVGRIKDSTRLDDLRQIVKVYDDLDKKVDADALWAIVSGLDEKIDEEPLEIAQAVFGNFVEVHCAAACFNQDGKILVARRPSSKRRFPGKWELGCGQIAMGETFADCLRRTYLEDFDVNLDIADCPIPVATYTISDKDERRKIPGVIFLARVLNPTAARPKRHDQIDWIDPSQPAPLTDDNCVPNLLGLLRQAAQIWNQASR